MLKHWPLPPSPHLHQVTGVPLGILSLLHSQSLSLIVHLHLFDLSSLAYGTVFPGFLSDVLPSRPSNLLSSATECSLPSLTWSHSTSVETSLPQIKCKSYLHTLCILILSLSTCFPFTIFHLFDPLCSVMILLFHEPLHLYKKLAVCTALNLPVPTFDFKWDWT